MIYNVLANFSGIRNVVEPTLLQYTEQSPKATFLYDVVNLDITNDFTLENRSGYSLRYNIGGNKAFYYNQKIYLATDNGIVEYNPETDETQLITSEINGNYEVAFCVAGDCLFVSNGHKIGTIVNGVFTNLENKQYIKDTEQLTIEIPKITYDNSSFDLTSGEIVETNSVGINSVITPLPAGQILTAFNARIYSANGRVIYYSLPYNLFFCDTSQNWIYFRDNITNVVAIPDGLIVTTLKEAYHLIGGSPETFKLKRISDTGAIFGSCVYLVDKKLVLWISGRYLFYYSLIDPDPIAKPQKNFQLSQEFTSCITAIINSENKDLCIFILRR